MSDWPGEWQSGAVLRAKRQSNSYTNDNGIRCLTGDVSAGEWLHMSGDIPENRC